MSRITIDDRIQSLREARELGVGRLSEASLAELDRVIAAAAERRALSSEHTVVGFFGATGSGKSSLFNAVVGEPLARTHVRRPTTSVPLAAVWRQDDASPLLDWLQVQDRRIPTHPFAGDPALPLILLDLPDFDSVQAEHREIATRLAGQVDVLVWVVDPQKYADATLHRDFIQPLATHAAVTAVVLNQIDRLAPAEIPQVVQSLESLIARDGLPNAEVMAASAVTGAGVDSVRLRIAKFARDRVAATARLTADVRRCAAAQLPRQVEAPATKEQSPSPARPFNADRSARAMREAIVSASGAELISQAVAKSYRKRAGQATGWPVTSWLLRFRPDPLRRLHLPAQQRTATDADAPVMARTSRQPLSAGQKAGMNRAVRSYVSDTSADLPEPWQEYMRGQGLTLSESVPDAVDQAIATTDLGAGRSWWWPLITALQVVSLLAGCVGAGWYLVLWAMQTLGFGFVEIPTVEGWPVPGLLLVFGVLLGIVLGTVAAFISAGVAGGRRRRAMRRLRASIGTAVDAHVAAPVRSERARALAFVNALRRAAAR